MFMSIADSPLVLFGERVVLSLPGADAAARMVSYFETNRAHLTPWEPPFPDGLFTNAFWERRLELNQREYRDGTSIRLVMAARDDPDGPIIGMANFTQFIRGAAMCCTLGYSLDQDAQGKGLMTEALRVAIRHLFETVGVHRVQASYIPTNERSGLLLRRLNFVVEGYARDYLFINGGWRDHVLTSLTNPKAPLPDYLVTGTRTRKHA